MKRFMASLVVFDVLVAYSFALLVEPISAIALFIAGLLFGVMGAVIAARRLYFLAGAAPHTALFAALSAVVAVYWIGLGLSSIYDIYLVSILIGVVTIYLAGYLIFRGVDPDHATSVLVAFASSFSVVVAYYIKSSLPIPFDILSVVFGDPLLVTWQDLAASIAAAIAVVVGIAVSYSAQVYLGVDRDSALLTGAPIWLYDLLFFTLLGVTVVALIKVVGFILEHILLLLPGALGASHGKSAGEALQVSVVSSLTATALGMLLSIAAPISPAGATGIAMLAIYTLAALWRR